MQSEADFTHTPDTCPAGSLLDCEFFGVRYRTSDFADAGRWKAQIEGHIPATFTGRRRDILASSTAIWVGTKLGGVPPYIDNPTSPPPAARFIGSLCQVSVLFDVAYPFVNRVTPMTPEELSRPSGTFLWHDGFILNLYLRGDESITWQMQLA